LGRIYNSAVKLSADDDVEEALFIASGVQTAIAAFNDGLKPIWALLGASAVADFSVLAGVETSTIIIGPDDAQAAEQCATRWRDTGREVIITAGVP
jgi:hypothetical protein